MIESLAGLDQALAYAAAGYRVLPLHHVVDGHCSCSKGRDCPSPGKHPRTEHGADDSSSDEATIRRWFKRWPAANLGLTLAGLIAIDVDPRNGGDVEFERLQAQHGPLPETCTQRTGGSGNHYLFLANGAKYGGHLAKGVDLKHGAGQFIVAEPSIHISGQRYSWLDETGPHEGGKPVEVPGWVATVSRQATTVISNDGAITEGERNATLTRLAGAMRRQNASQEAMEAALLTQNATCKPPLPDAEVKSIASSVARYEAGHVDHVMRGYGTPEQPPPRFTGIWASAISPQLTGLYVIKGLIPDQAVIEIYGRWSSGKTALAIDIACHVALGLVWRGRKVRGGPVAYVALENPRSVENRVLGWCMHHNIERDRMPLLIVRGAVNFLQPNMAEAIIAYLREHGEFRMCFWDTLARAIPGGDENTSGAMSAVIGAMDQIRLALGCTQALVHHEGKDAGKGSRGHSSLPAAIDTEIHITDGAAEISKQRDMVPAERLTFGIESVAIGQDEDGEDVTTPVAIATDGRRPRTPPKLTGVASIALAALREVIADQGVALPATSAIPPGRTGVTEDKWRQQFGRRYGTDDKHSEETTARAFRRAKEKLLGDKLVGLLSPWCWLW